MCSYQREAQYWNTATDDSSVIEIELRDGTAYLTSLQVKDIRVVVNVAQTATLFHGFKIRILSQSGYWGSNGQDVIVAPNRTGDVLTRDYTTHFLHLIDVQTRKPTEKMQPIKLQLLTLDDVPIRRDFIYLRFLATWAPNEMRTFGESFIAH